MNHNRQRPRHALVISRSLAGHRQIYLHVFTEYFLEKGFDVVIVVEEGQHSPLLNLFQLNPCVRVVKIQHGSSDTKMIPFAFLKKIQADSGIELTVFVDGDDLRRSMISGRVIAESLGPSIGVFLKLTRFAPMPKLNSSIRGILDIARYMRNRLYDRIFFEHMLKVDKKSFQAFVLDPRLPNILNRPYLHWLPDIYSTFADESNIEQNNLYDDLQMFLAGTVAQERILYYGTNQLRRGYAWLLRLVSESSDAVLIHCGRLNERHDMTETTSKQRIQLMAEGRLFETRCFVTDRRITDCAYGVCKTVLLPYQNQYGSSGIMLQASSYGKPVLVPRGGLMAYWVMKHGFGRTFGEGSYDDFLQEVEFLRQNYHDYVIPAKQFAERFTREHVYAALDHGLAQVGV